MLEFLFKKAPKENKSEKIKNYYKKVKELYAKEQISHERQKELGDLIEKYGYLPYSQSKALEELNSAETIFCLEKKLELNETYKNNELNFEENLISAVKRAGYTDADWIKREQHDIKLINLAGLGNGAEDLSPAKFIDWLKQIVILPAGNLSQGVMATTIYLVPFHPRDFGNAYLTSSAEEVSERLADKELKQNGITPKEQIKLFKFKY